MLKTFMMKNQHLNAVQSSVESPREIIAHHVYVHTIQGSLLVSFSLRHSERISFLRQYER